MVAGSSTRRATGTGRLVTQPDGFERTATCLWQVVGTKHKINSQIALERPRQFGSIFYSFSTYIGIQTK